MKKAGEDSCATGVRFGIKNRKSSMRGDGLRSKPNIVRNGEGDPHYTGGEINVAGLVVDGIGRTGRGCQKKRRCAQSHHYTEHSIVIDFATYMMPRAAVPVTPQGS